MGGEEKTGKPLPVANELIKHRSLRLICSTLPCLKFSMPRAVPSSCGMLGAEFYMTNPCTQQLQGQTSTGCFIFTKCICYRICDGIAPTVTGPSSERGHADRLQNSAYSDDLQGETGVCFYVHGVLACDNDDPRLHWF